MTEITPEAAETWAELMVTAAKRRLAAMKNAEATSEKGGLSCECQLRSVLSSNALGGETGTNVRSVS